MHQDESPHGHQPTGGPPFSPETPSDRSHALPDPTRHGTLPSGFTFGNPQPVGATAASPKDASTADDRSETNGEPHDPSPEWNLNMETDTDAPQADHADDARTDRATGDDADPKAAKRAEKQASQRAKAEAKAAAKETKRQAKEAKKAAKAAKRTGAATSDEPDGGPEMSDGPNADSDPHPLDLGNASGEPGEHHDEDRSEAAEEEPIAWAAVGDAAVEPVPDADGQEVGLLLAAEDAEGDAPGEAPHARLGLRMGVHQKGGLIAQIKARLGLGGEQTAAVVTAQHQEEEEALAERIEPDERYKEIETYPIHPPYAHVRILYDDDMKEYVYQVLEPVLTRTEKEILEFIESTLVDTLSVSPAELEDADELEFITERFNDVIFDYSIILHEDEAEEVEIKKKLLYYIRRDFIGHGPIDAIMEDPYIEDISCDGPHVPIFLYHRKYESVRSTVIFGEHDVLDSYVIKMAQRAGKHISIAEPILDATMTDGSRLQSTLAKEVSAAGSTFTIRKFRPDPFTPPDLVMFRTMSAEMLAYLWISVQNGASIMYAGGTASGKTTSLNAILLFIPPNMKIVSIEDTREVNLPHENWIAGITRHGFGPRDQFGRQAGEIDMFQLLKNALRQRPEYIIVGEVRGQEAYSLFQAMATGHAAYGTMHADSVDAVIHRLESDPINIPRSLLEALDIVSVQVQTRVDGKRVRRTKQISEIVGLDPHTREILTNEVFRWQPEDDSFKFSGVSYSLEKFQMEKGLPAGAMIKELKRRAQIIGWMIDRKIQNYKEVNKVVSAYYKEPETLMKLVNGELAPDEVPIGLREIASRGDDVVDTNPLSAAALAAGKVSLADEDEDAPRARKPAEVHTLADAAHAPYPEPDEEPALAYAADDRPAPLASERDEAPAFAEPPSDEHPARRVAELDEAPAFAEPPSDEHPARRVAERDEAPALHAEPAAEPAANAEPRPGPAPTEKAQDWNGMDALFQAAEKHAKAEAKPDEPDRGAVATPSDDLPWAKSAPAHGADTHPGDDVDAWLREREARGAKREDRASGSVHDAGAKKHPDLPWSKSAPTAPDAPGDDPEAWLSEREAEARDAKADVDEAVESRSRSPEEEAAARERRLKRASGGEGNQ